jgi:hypothetical protein
MPPRLAKIAKPVEVESYESYEPETQPVSQSQPSSKNSTLRGNNQNSLIVTEYTEKSVVVTGDTVFHSKNLQKLGGKFNPNLKIGAGWIFSKTRKESIENYIKTGEILPFVFNSKVVKDSESLTKVFAMLKTAFNEDEEYDGKDIIETIKRIEKEFGVGNIVPVVPVVTKTNKPVTKPNYGYASSENEDE